MDLIFDFNPQINIFLYNNAFCVDNFALINYYFIT